MKFIGFETEKLGIFFIKTSFLIAFMKMQNLLLTSAHVF